MIPLTRVEVYSGAVDFRKSIDGLALLIQQAGFVWSDPALQHTGFAFFSKDRSKIKLLIWDRNGFWLCYKRLECGRFRAMAPGTLSWQELALVLQGIDVSVRRLPAVQITAVA